MRPGGVTIDASGNLYVTDTYNHAIRKVTPAGVVTTLAGAYPTATAGFQDGDGSSARFNTPVGIVLDASGSNLYVADSLNHAIRKVRLSDGDTRTLAGAYPTKATGFVNETGAAARFNTPRGLAIDATGNLYVADSSNHAIRMVTSAGVVTTHAGSGTSGFTDGATSSAKFNNPAGVAMDATGNVYVADYLNHAIRKITAQSGVTTLAGSYPTVSAGSVNGTGTGAKFNQPWSLATDTSGNLYVADKNNHLIRKVTPAGLVTTFAGANSGFVNGVGSVAAFSSPEAIVFDAARGVFYVADAFNHAIRKITP
ncbi:Serine/threonine-protein kinase PknD [compost metagenome]